MKANISLKAWQVRSGQLNLTSFIFVRLARAKFFRKIVFRISSICEDAVEARYCSRGQNAAHVTSYAHIGLAATLKDDHEFATGSAQLPAVSPTVLFCAHMVFLMMFRGKGSEDTVKRMFGVDDIGPLPYMVTGNYQPHLTALLFLPIRAWCPTFPKSFLEILTP